MLEILSKEKQPKRRPVRALVLTLTRELAAQVSDNVKASVNFSFGVYCFWWCQSKPLVRALKNGRYINRNPGRLLDLFNQGFPFF